MTDNLFIERKYRCPKCGAENSKLSVSIEEYAGEYCLTCWARWISENIPRLEEIALSNAKKEMMVS